MCALEGHEQVVTLLLTHGAHISLNREGASFFDILVQRHHKNALMAAIQHDRCARAAPTRFRIRFAHTGPITFALVRRIACGPSFAPFHPIINPYQSSAQFPRI